MARGSHIQTSKTRIRHYFRLVAEHRAEDIDRFRDHVAKALEAEQRSVHRRASELPPEVQELLADELAELEIVAVLADQLSIVALYNVVELTTRLMLVHEFGKCAKNDASHWGKLSNTLKMKRRIDLKTVPQYRAINELRLLNNAIKHEGRVTKALAEAYPSWRVGDELTCLDQAYERLRPEVPAYIFGLAELMAARSIS